MCGGTGFKPWLNEIFVMNEKTESPTDPNEKKPSGARAESTEIATDDRSRNAKEKAKKPKEVGGPKGPEPTRYGDWERKGRCIDF